MNWPGKTLALLLLLALVPMAAHAESSAQAVVRGFYAHLVATMKQGDEVGYNGRYKKIDPALRTAFNLPLMAQTAVGASWAGASAQEQADLVAAFADFSVASYANRFASYNGEQFTVTGEKPTPNGVIVESVLKPREGEPITLNYLLRQDETGAYRIVDVLINGTISEMATRRAEFSSIARRDGISALVNALGEKSKQLGPS
jgi:phospholipid transport system substrate-binding protein